MLKSLKSKKHLFVPLSILIFFLTGCKSPEAARKETDPNAGFTEFLRKYEPTFKPSMYNDPVEKILQDEKREREAVEAARVMKIAPPETIPGFRVQVNFTPEIDAANRTRDSLLTLLPDDLTYVVYETPYYKIRVGNYADRSDANMMLKKLTSLGFKDSWVVPDRIIINPPPRIPDGYIQPEIQPRFR